MANSTELINRISEISNNYDVVFLAYHGVIFDGETHYPFAAEVIDRLRREGKDIVIIANDARRAQTLSEEMENNGISSDLYNGILSSGEVVYHEIIRKTNEFYQNLGVCYYHIGKEEYANIWLDGGYVPVKSIEDAEFVIVSSSEYKQDAIERYLPVLRKAADMNLPMLCVNPNKSLNLAGSDDIGAGTIASRYEAVGGNVYFRGKPQKDIFEYCLEAFPEVDKRKILMIANSYLTDIKGAVECNIDTMLVASGSHARELGVTLGKSLDLRFVDELSRHYGFFPDYVVSDFKY